MDWRTGHKQVPNTLLNNAPRNPLLVVRAFKVVGVGDMGAVEVDFHKLFVCTVLRKRQIQGMKRSTQDLLEMAFATGGTTVAAKQWLDAGFSPGDAKAYVDAGCFDVDRTLELKRVGISPLDIARSGQAWDYCSGNISLSQLLKSKRPVETPELAFAAYG